MTLPSAFLQRLSRIVGEPMAAEVVQSFSQPRPTAFRINTLLTSPADCLNQLQSLGLQPRPFTEIEHAFTIPHSEREILTHSDLISSGHVYIQSLSSMLAPVALAAQAHEEILDLTAAPGSKTTQIACMMQNTGRIAAVEKSKSRFFKLKSVCQQQGVRCCDFYCKDGSQVWRHCQNRFHRVLLDAPCSSETRFQTNDAESVAYWSEAKIKAMARVQWTLLYSAFHCVKPGGLLVYSTCTFAPEENEMQIARLLKRFPNQVEVLPFELSLINKQPGLLQWQNKQFPEQLRHCVRILPNEWMPGFFIARLRKL